MESSVILLDTGVLIEVLRRKDKSSTLFYSLAVQGKELSVSSITVYEFRNGMTTINEELCEALLLRLITLPFDDKAARTAATIYRSLKSQRNLIEVADILIAATAIAHDIPLATLNIKHFQRIVHLNLITP
jgi:tRNA(fMet)-specific endonuclease VapC